MNSGSYFPPVDCWSSRLPSPVVPGPAPLLPTPIPTALPSTLGGTLNEVPPHVVDPEVPLIPPPTCSCPVTDTCVAESLALLLGSFKLLYQVVTKLKKSVAGRLDLGKDAVGPIATALSRFEVSIRKLLAPVLEAEGIEMESLLLQQWLRPVQAPAIDDDVCSWIRRKVDSLLIDVVDTFPPMQHTVHMLLVRHEFGSRRLQSVLEALKVRMENAASPLASPRR